MDIQKLGAGIFTIDGFLGADACDALIAKSESMGYSEATIHTDDGERLYADARNNDRIVFDDAVLADELFQLAKTSLPPFMDDWHLQGFNHRFRFYRYEKQQKFDWHLDGTVRLGDKLESCLTFMIYLNDNFEGGSTEFGWEKVRPARGMALVFPHRVRHQGSVVASGVKYVLRTDVMYSLA